MCKMTENMQADVALSRKAVFVRCCLSNEVGAVDAAVEEMHEFDEGKTEQKTDKEGKGYESKEHEDIVQVNREISACDRFTEDIVSVAERQERRNRLKRSRQHF